MTARWSPVIDRVFLLTLGTIAFFGLHDVFTGWSFLVAGTAGLALGMLLAVLVTRLRQPLILLVVLVIAAFFLLGGLVAFHALGGSNLLPVPHTLSDLADTSVHGWKDILTTHPPVDGGPLLTLPYLVGLVAGAVGTALADRSRWSVAPVLVPVAVLAVVILLGVAKPGEVALQGAIFAALAIAWVVVRARRFRQRSSTSRRRTSRQATAVVLCAAAAAVALVAGPHLPGLREDRVVLRSHIQEPYDVGQFASPLVGFRRFTKGYGRMPHAVDPLYNKPLFKVAGLPPGTPIRLAALDSYDGHVWGAGNIAGEAVDPDLAGTFEKVGHVIDNPSSGKAVTGRIQILDRSAMQVWLPEAGSLTGISFQGADGRSLGDQFRYNLATSTGVVPGGLSDGDSYEFDAVLPDDTLTRSTPLAQGGLAGADGVNQFTQTATAWAGRATGSPIATIWQLADYLRTNGHYTDGDGAFSYISAGHSIMRLQAFTSTLGQLAGNDEQYAALLALMGNELGVPTRVVVGADTWNPATGVVTGQDIHAWVEVQAEDGTWRTMLPKEFMDPTRTPKKQTPKNQQAVSATSIPPPAPVHPPATAGQPLNSVLNHNAHTSHTFHLPGWIVWILLHVLLPLLVVAALCYAIVLGKSVRRRRRRTRGTPTRRLAAAWHEILDSARDLGHVAPARGTRREQATALAVPRIAESARLADNVMFGAAQPDDATVEEFWTHVDAVRRDLPSDLGRWRRLRAALNPITFLPRGARRA